MNNRTRIRQMPDTVKRIKQIRRKPDTVYADLFFLASISKDSTGFGILFCISSQIF
jgi:hypothetical protein